MFVLVVCQVTWLPATFEVNCCVIETMTVPIRGGVCPYNYTVTLVYVTCHFFPRRKRKAGRSVIVCIHESQPQEIRFWWQEGKVQFECKLCLLQAPVVPYIQALPGVIYLFNLLFFLARVCCGLACPQHGGGPGARNLKKKWKFAEHVLCLSNQTWFCSSRLGL